MPEFNVNVDWDTWHTQCEYLLKDIAMFHDTLHQRMEEFGAMQDAVHMELEDEIKKIDPDPDRVLDLYRMSAVVDSKRQSMAALHALVKQAEMNTARTIPPERLAEDPDLQPYEDCDR